MPTKLGQNFLQDTLVLEKIIHSISAHPADSILEVGPGKGILTEKLAHCAKNVLAIEIDMELIPFLKQRFLSMPNIEIIHEDILGINLPKLLENIPSYKLVANIPYYITSKIIRLFLEQTKQPQEMILMIQKEVAERIVAPQGQSSILSIAINYYAAAEILFSVDKTAFLPVPKVDSAVIRITPHQSFDASLDKNFFRLVRIGFSSKRKTLLNNLAIGLQLDKQLLEEILQKISFTAHTRAQELTVTDWKELCVLLDK
jgi:16S rRNA (adenine1518-N6/adenine1519-N6)-dimethyltransferase